MSGPSLEQLTLEAVRKLLEGDSELEGIVLQQSKGKVYVDLGQSHGIRPGDSFDVVESGTEIRHPVSGEVLAVDRQKMARLRVIQVQDKLSICEVTSGKLPSPLSSGAGALRVSRQRSGGAKVVAGAVEAQSGTMVRQQALKAAVDAALRETGKRGSGKDAAYRIDAEAVRGQGGVTVRLSLVSIGTGSAVSQTSFSFVPQTRYRTVFQTTLNRQLNLDPIAVQAQKSYTAERGGDYVLIRRIGTDVHDVAVMNDGRCFVLLNKGLKSLKDVDRAFGTFQLVTNSFIKTVRADIADDTAREAWYRDLVVYTSQGNIYRRISIPAGQKGWSYILDVPNLRVREANMWVVGTWSNPQYRGEHISVGNCPRLRILHGTNQVNVKCGVNYGEQKIQMHRSTYATALEFLTEEGPGQFVLFDIAHNPIGTVMPPCRPISELSLSFIYN